MADGYSPDPGVHRRRLFRSSPGEESGPGEGAWSQVVGNTYISFLLIAALLVPVFAFVRNPNALLFIGPLVGFFGTGYFAGFSVIASELFPTALRASAMGFVYNIGRVLSAAAPYLIGRVSEHAGLSWALCMTSAAFVGAALIATALRSPAGQVSEMMALPVGDLRLDEP